MKIIKFTVGSLETNCYILQTDQCFAVIDPGALSPPLTQYLKNTSLICSYIILTHNHYDHIGAVNPLKQMFSSAHIVMHHQDYIHLGNPLYTGEILFGQKVKKFHTDIVVNSETELLMMADKSNQQVKVELIHTPGHTAGGISVRVGHNLFTGDTLFKQGIGRCDLPSGDIKKLCRSIKKYYSWGVNYQVFPGHGPNTSLDQETESLNYYCPDLFD